LSRGAKDALGAPSSRRVEPKEPSRHPRRSDTTRDPLFGSGLLFGQVSSQSAGTAVVRRLRTAIALGLLADGDKLPREADLVRRFGVTAFAVREALSVLRNEGLITTRPGNQGGSFVRYGTDRNLLTSAELRRMSSKDLRDLGDWRQMLVSASAALAAQRASVSNVDRLRGYADALASATTELEVRRAHGRFHIELAAAAQSTRMTQAELGLYEEFDWLFGAALSDPQRRRQAARDLAAIAGAVADHSPALARAAAEEHTAATVDALVQLRLTSIASAKVGKPSARGAEADSVATELARVVDTIGGRLQSLSAAVATVMQERVAESELRMRLARAVVSGLADDQVALDGLGFLAEPGTVSGAEYVMTWWVLTPNGVVVDERHVLDPKREDFYEYNRQDFFQIPRRSGRLYAQGPYVDYGGTNDYVISFSFPVILVDQFIGVAVADLLVATLEHQLAPWLAVISEPCVVINDERRVIVSNVADHIVGDVLGEARGATLAHVDQVGWQVCTER